MASPNVKVPAVSASSATPSKEPKPLPFIYQFNAGAIAGVTECLIMYPLDVVKTRIQLDPALRGQGTFKVMSQIIKNEGISRLYKGIGAPLTLEPPKRAVKFAANDFWGKAYRKLFGMDHMNFGLSVLTGATAGITEAFIVVPFELVKIRIQDKNSVFNGPMEVVRSIIASEGPSGMMRGLEATLWRHASWNAGYFGVIYALRSKLPKPTSKTSKLFNDFIAGTAGGFVGTLLNTPFDVVKSRMQSFIPRDGNVPKYIWTVPSIATVAREEGVRALYSGFTPKVLRLAPGGGILLIVVDAVLSATRQYLGPPYI